MRAVAVVVVALFVAVLAVAACARAQVGSWSNCVASFEGTNGTIFYDLNPGTGDKTVEPAGDYKFLMDLCQSVTGTTDPCTAGSTYNCQIAKAGELPFRKVASTATTPIATLDGNGRLVVTYGGGDLCPNFGNVARTSVIAFTCDPNIDGVPVYVNEVDCVYTFTWQGKIGCPTTAAPGGGSSGGLSGGDVFLIIFFVGGFLYVAVGYGYNYQFRELRGVEAVPNVDFWRGLPGLVKDGAVFTYSSIAGLLSKSN